MEAPIGQKRNAMEMCQKLIPFMTSEEIGQIALVLQQTIDRLIKEGRVSEE